MSTPIKLEFTGTAQEKQLFIKKVLLPKLFGKRVLILKALSALILLNFLIGLYHSHIPIYDLSAYNAHAITNLVTFAITIFMVFKFTKIKQKISKQANKNRKLSVILDDSGLTMLSESDSESISRTIAFNEIKKVNSFNNGVVFYSSATSLSLLNKVIPSPIYSDAFKNFKRDEFIKVLKDKCDLS